VTEKAKWTFLTYIAAHNNLDCLGERSLDQIIGVGSTRQVRHGVLYDGPKGAARYIVGGPGKVLQQEQLADFDSGDPDALIETARWVFCKYPADRYGLVLWSHGSGWQPEEIQRVAKQVRKDNDVDRKESIKRAGSTSSRALFRTTLAKILIKSAAQRAICFDDGSRHSIDTIELGKVIRAITDKIDQPLELLGMDACLMASLEVAYQIRDNTRYMVASEELVPGHSWPYNVIFQKLNYDPSINGSEFAQIITLEYRKYYQENPPAFGYGDVTKVALDLSKIGEIATATDKLSRDLINNMEAESQNLWDAQIFTRDQEKGKRPQTKFDLYLWDIKSLVNELSMHIDNEEITSSCKSVADSLKLGGAILDEVHLEDWFSNIGGLSIYLPIPNEAPRVTKYYPQLQFAVSTDWYEMLMEYHQTTGKKRRVYLP
jgi:hypothetical protein